ncbi:MAG: glycine cleavage system protein H [Planctomycetes bacterium]|jgi:glycine cleavage system H protein|nr:glycine cleavage system protein H [Planctomycetota bacterium]
MPELTPDVRYKRSRFSTRLPNELRYTAGHLWLRERPDHRWEVGITKFALRMLGDPVEIDFEVKAGERLQTGQIIGWVEGFKAVSDLFAPLEGTFVEVNRALEEDIGLMQSSPYARGWLYAIQGRPGADCVDVRGYVDHLDATIDRMLGQES